MHTLSIPLSASVILFSDSFFRFLHCASQMQDIPDNVGHHVGCHNTDLHFWQDLIHLLSLYRHNRLLSPLAAAAAATAAITAQVDHQALHTAVAEIHHCIRITVTLSGTLIPLGAAVLQLGKKLPVYGDGKNVRDWLYVEDHAKAIDMVQEKGRLFETYNVGGHNEKQNIEIIHIILDTLQEMLPDDDPRKKLVSENLITYVEDRKGHDRRYAIAPDKIKAEIGWEPETMFKEGIKRTIAWYFEHEDWMKNVTSGDYQKYYDDMYQNR